MNHITLIGRLTADPELSAPKGNPVCRFRIAVDRINADGAALERAADMGGADAELAEAAPLEADQATSEMDEASLAEVEGEETPEEEQGGILRGWIEAAKTGDMDKV